MGWYSDKCSKTISTLKPYLALKFSIIKHIFKFNNLHTIEHFRPISFSPLFHKYLRKPLI